MLRIAWCNGPLTDPEISSNILARVTGQDHLHNLVLPASEASEVISRNLCAIPRASGNHEIIRERARRQREAQRHGAGSEANPISPATDQQL
jgi:hypothetical protein